MTLLVWGMLVFTRCQNDQETEPAPFAGSCPISEQARAAVTENAARVALYQLYQSRSPDTARVEIAQLENYTKILGLVYDRTDIAQRDSVIGIRHTEGRALTILELHLDPTVNWVGQWLAGNPNTDNPQVNQLIKAYELTLTRPGSLFTVQGKKPLNAPALYQQFKNIAGVKGGYYQAGALRAGRMDISIAGDKATVQYFDVGGYCINNSRCNTRYDFEVGNDCRVNYKGSVKLP
jgi:hypothetical protein